jgi:cellulose biosynthesis protein BcsQ
MWNLFAVFSNFKGGVGKTTLAICFARVLAAASHRVMLVDLDHQRNLSQFFLAGQTVPANKTLSACIRHGDARACIVPSHIVNTDILPGSYDILDFRDAPIETLTEVLMPIRDEYSAIIIDCPPTIDNLVVSAWQLADVLVTPAHLHGFDLEGLRYLEACIARETNFDLANWRIVLNAIREPRKTEQRSLDLQYDDVFRRTFKNLTQTRIPRLAAIQDAVRKCNDITATNKTRLAYDRLVQLATEISGHAVTPTDGYF